MAGYTTITVNGQEIGLRFSIDAIRMAMQKNAVKILDGTIQTPDTISTARYLHCAHIVDCIVKEKQPDITFEQLYDWADEQFYIGAKELVRLTDVISESTRISSKEENKKKAKTRKLIGKKLSHSV